MAKNKKQKSGLEGVRDFFVHLGDITEAVKKIMVSGIAILTVSGIGVGVYKGVQLNDKYTRASLLNLIYQEEGWQSLKEAGPEMRKDRRIVSEAVSHDVRAFAYADESLKKDREFILELIKGLDEPGILEYASEELRADPEFMLMAFAYNQGAIQYATPEVQQIAKKLVEQFEKLRDQLGGTIESVIPQQININQGTGEVDSIELNMLLFPEE